VIGEIIVNVPSMGEPKQLGCISQEQLVAGGNKEGRIFGWGKEHSDTGGK